MNKIIRVDFSQRGKDLRELEKTRKEDWAQERREERIRKAVNQDYFSHGLLEKRILAPIIYLHCKL